MSITICVLFAAIIKCSTAEINLNAFTKAKGGDRSLLQSRGETITSEDANSATSIDCDSSDSGTYGTSPEYWVFNNDQRQSVTFSNCESTFDTNLYVYNSSLEWISESECGGDDCDMENSCDTGAREMFAMDLDPGTYYVELYPCCSFDDTDEDGETYVLSLTCSPPTPEPTRAPTYISDDLSNCESVFDTSIPATNEITNYWFTIDSSQNSIIGIDACDYGQGQNDFEGFTIYLLPNPYEDIDNYYASANFGNTPGRCTDNGDGAYLEYDTQFDGYTNWWLRVVIYDSSLPNRRLQLTRKCEIKPTTDEPTPFPTTPAPISPMSTTLFCGSRMTTTVQAGNVLPHYYLLDLNEPSKVNFQDCETDFDSNLFVYAYDGDTMEELNQLNDCSDDCGDCSAYTDSSTRENYALNLNSGQYLVMIRRCCGNYEDATGQQYVLEITCEEATGSPTTPEPSSDPTPYPSPYPTTEMPSRSPLFPGETHPPTTAMPTRPPTTKRPSGQPTTKPTKGPTPVKSDKHVTVGGAVNYSVIGNMICILAVVIGILFV